jgi:hypothetical protein
LGRSGSETSFRLAQIGRSPLGRGGVKLEWEVKPLGALFDGSGLQQSAGFIDTGLTGANFNMLVGGLAPNTPYHWRMRTIYYLVTSPFQQRGRWITNATNGANEADLRTSGAAVPGDLTGDGQVNVDDLLAVIGAWGACPPPPETCDADITGDGVVNVDDLLAVIGAWGP